MLIPRRPDNEAQRLQTLYDYRILDSQAEQDFDDLAAMAAHVCQVPIALITFLDTERQWFKSKIGTDLTHCPRDLSFCGHAILETGVFVIPDASRDERFADNPVVIGGPKIRFYAGSPLIGPEGHAFGTLCVLDQVPRELTSDQLEALRSLSRQVVSQMRLRKSAASLAWLEQSTRSTLDAISAAIITVSESGEILGASRSWQDANEGHGLVVGCGIGSNYFDVCDALVEQTTDGSPPLSHQLRRILSGELAQLATDFKAGDEQDNRWFQLKATRATDQEFARLVIVHEDITAQKRAHELELERRSLKDAVASLEQVLGVVGHELRTPLAGLRAMTDFLMDPAAQGTPEWALFLSSLGTEVVRMSDMVDSLLEAARINSGKAKWNWSSFDVQPICQEALDGVQLMIDEDRAVKFICRMDEPSLRMNGDASALRRLLINVVRNASKHTAQGEIAINVHTAIEDQKQWIVFEVSDTGEGIEPAILSRLGEAFALNSGVVGANHIGGTGLGLAICKGIAAAHAGWLAIKSEPGRGTTVSARLRADLLVPHTGTESASIVLTDQRNEPLAIAA